MQARCFNSMLLAGVAVLLLTLSVTVHARNLVGTEANNALSRPPAELSQSFIVASLQDLQPQNIHGKWQTPCQYAVDQARGVGGKHFSIVVTAYWFGGKSGITRYAFKDVTNAYPNGVGFPSPSIQLLSSWKTGLQVLNHIDSAEGTAWRNFVDFDPIKRYGGFSYEDVIVRPTADALRTVTRPHTKVWYMFSGEMGRSLWGYPVSWARLQGKYRGALAKGKSQERVKVGIALHWNKVCGDCFNVGSFHRHETYNATYTMAFKANRAAIMKKFNIAAIQHLFINSDVLGISHYAPMPVKGLTPSDFDMPINTAAHELAAWGINLRALITTRPFVFAEVGLGGANADDQAPAPSLEYVAYNPLDGIWAPYTPSIDPWRRGDYQYYRRVWHKNLIKWLLRGGGPYWKVDAAFIWSVGSWDVAAVHPISTSSEGSFADGEVMKYLRYLSSKVPW